MPYDNEPAYQSSYWKDYAVILGLCLIPVLGYFGPKWFKSKEVV